MSVKAVLEQKRQKVAVFGPVWGASGVQGWFGEGYWYSRLLALAGVDLKSITLVAKTTTLDERVGNMPLRWDRMTPREWKPDCIRINFREAAVLNAVGLSGPGFAFLLYQRRWQEIREPFFLSFMPVATTPEGREAEVAGFVALLRDHLATFRTRHLGIQLNVSCPNTGHDLAQFILEVERWLELLGQLPSRLITIVVKINTLIPLETVARLSDHEHCHGLCISNTVPWGKYPELIDWKRLFGSDVSPLAHIGGGGLSGRPIMPIACQYIADVRRTGVHIPINGGGGITCSADPKVFRAVGANSCFVGSGYMVRGYQFNGVINEARHAFRHGA